MACLDERKDCTALVRLRLKVDGEMNALARMKARYNDSIEIQK